MSVERCELTDLPTDMCAHCRGLTEARPTDGLRAVRRITARFDGVCQVSAQHRVAAGDPLYLAVDAAGTGYWVCSDCARSILP